MMSLHFLKSYTNFYTTLTLSYCIITGTSILPYHKT